MGTFIQEPKENVLLPSLLLLISGLILPILSFIFARFDSALIGEILAGAIFGPHLLNTVPIVEGLTVVGTVGLWLLVLEGGLSVNVEKLKNVWFISLLVALVGMVFPVILTWVSHLIFLFFFVFFGLFFSLLNKHI